MVNDKKIAFIICTNNDRWYNECVQYLARLELPDGFDADVLQIVDAKSMTSGYNEGMNASDAKYKIYLHHDLFIIRTDFIKRVIEAFQEHPEIGIMGVLGTDKIVPNGSYWDHWDSGKVYALDAMQPFKVCGPNTYTGGVTSAKAVDGMILMTQYDVEWREDIFTGWDFYDVSQCFEFIRKGYEVAVFHENEISIMHDCGYSKLANYNDGREKFCKEYAEFGFVYENSEDEDVSAKEKSIAEFLKEFNWTMTKDVDKAVSLVEQIYSDKLRDNKIAILKIIFDICVKEKSVNSKASFASKGDTWEGLIDKYTAYKFLIRQVELDVCQEAAKELYDELENDRISLQAIGEIACHCCYDGAKMIYKLQDEMEKEAERKSVWEEEKNENCPKVSVLLPAYNHENFIEECVESVLNQTYKNIEFIIGDDASTDGTVEKLMKYQDRIDEIHLFDENRGGTTGFLIGQATGDYIAIINSDDVWKSVKLEKQIKALQENPDAVACFTWCNRVDESGKELEETNHFNIKNRTKEEWMNYFYFNGNCFAYSSILIRKDIFMEYTEPNGSRFRQLPDFYKWIRIVQDYDIVVLEEPLIKVRVVNNKTRKNVSAASRDNLLRHFNEESWIWYKVISDMNPEYFKKAFYNQLVDKNVSNESAILCEKLFILLQTKVEYCKLAAVFFYYDYCHEMKDVLEERYGFTRRDMFDLIAKIGPCSYIK